VNPLSDRLRRHDILLTGLVLAAVLFLLRSAGQSPDGLSYAAAVRDGVGMFHPHHLLYVPVTRVLYLLLGGRDPLVAGTIHNLAWLVVLGIGARRLARELGWSPGAAWLAATVLLASRGVVFHATHVETYLPALACLAMFTAAWFAPGRRGPAAVWLALAVLYHQTNVLVVVPALAASEDRRRDLLAVVLPAGTVVLALYVIGWRLEAGDAGFFAWLTSYARADVPAWGSFGHFGFGGLRDAGANQLRMLLPVPAGLAGPGAAALWCGIAALTAHHVRRSTRTGIRRYGLVFLAVYLVFFVWWIPSDADFFLATLLPLWWLALIALDDLGGRWRGRWWAGPAALLLAGNLVFTAWRAHRDPGPAHAAALALDRVAPRGAMLVVGYATQQELLYYTPRRDVWEGDALGTSAVRSGETLPDRDEIVVGADYLRTIATRRGPADEALLRWLLAYDPPRTMRTWRSLPDGAGIVVGPESRRPPLPAWPAAVDELLAGPRR